MRTQAVQEYLTQGYTYRRLAEKYGVSRSTINTWVLVYQGIHHLPRSKRQNSYDLQQMSKAKTAHKQSWPSLWQAEEKIAVLEKQLAYEKMRADALDTMITIAEKECNVSIRKKPGAEQSAKSNKCMHTMTCNRCAGCSAFPGRRTISTSKSKSNNKAKKHLFCNRLLASEKNNHGWVPVSCWCCFSLSLPEHNIAIGRDAFFELLGENRLLIRKRKTGVFTPNSKHFFYCYPNLAKGFTPLHPHELWVADSTFITLRERFAYL
ncbi:MAG: helix-turn-helix domain-containing protein [Flavisolibacter sp.]|nr:helix-turn-helix domain-containing protein [Flavisolibacter sp.]